MNILQDLKSRGILNNITNEEKFKSLPKGTGVYIGFDPTAESLHLGNYIQISILKRFKAAGFNAFAIVGGATGMIGDPSGKSQERNLLNRETLENNKNKIKTQLESFGLTVVDNYDFYKDVNILDFLRNTGKLLNVAYMINKDIVKNRLETGISFTEFSYQLIQGWDFYSMYKNFNTKIQVGGSDQWGNITSGIEIIRKQIGDKHEGVGITTELLTTASGKKFGKSEGNAFFIDKKLTQPFDMHQYLLNTPDDDVEKLLKWITFLSIDEIKAIMSKHNEKPKLRIAQNKLADEIIKDVYSEDALKAIHLAKNILFGTEDVSSLTTKEVLSLEGIVQSFETEQTEILELLVEINASTSKREAREFIGNGAIEINGNKITDVSAMIDKKHFDGKATIIKRGKKKFFLIKHK